MPQFGRYTISTRVSSPLLRPLPSSITPCPSCASVSVPNRYVESASIVFVLMTNYRNPYVKCRVALSPGHRPSHLRLYETSSIVAKLNLSYLTKTSLIILCIQNNHFCIHNSYFCIQKYPFRVHFSVYMRYVKLNDLSFSLKYSC